MYIMVKKFQKNVLFVAITLLAICVIILIILMRKNDGKSFETDVNKCPDYFTMSSVDKCVSNSDGRDTDSCNTAWGETKCDEDESCKWIPKGKCLNKKKLGDYGYLYPSTICNLINEDDTFPRVNGTIKFWDSKVKKNKYAN